MRRTDPIKPLDEGIRELMEPSEAFSYTGLPVTRSVPPSAAVLATNDSISSISRSRPIKRSPVGCIERV